MLGRPELTEGGREEVGQGGVGKSSSQKPGICKGEAEHGECPKLASAFCGWRYGNAGPERGRCEEETGTGEGQSEKLER